MYHHSIDLLKLMMCLNCPLDLLYVPTYVYVQDTDVHTYVHIWIALKFQVILKFFEYYYVLTYIILK